MNSIEREIKNFKFTDIDAAVKFAVGLKKHVDDSEKYLMMFLCRLDDSGLWKGHTGKGRETFANWLRINLSMNPKRYDNGRKALIDIDSDIIKITGFKAAVVIAGVNNLRDRKKVLNGCRAWTEDPKNKGPIPERTARAIASVVVPPKKASTSLSEIATLRAEKAALEVEIHKLETKCHELEIELTQYREQFGALPKSGISRISKKSKKKENVASLS